MVQAMDQELFRERWMVMDQRAIEGAMDGARDGSGSNRRSDGWIKLWMR
jgi:hypothetical protein